MNNLYEVEKSELIRIAKVLGPMPRETLIAMMDYGMNDEEIGKYFNLKEGTVKILRHYLKSRPDLFSVPISDQPHSIGEAEGVSIRFSK
ncbi:hypothetical protein EYC08_20440 [Tabrizicola sp. WMC-M-20]|nr:hypothetical protein EYC08_20440 [Tabrizicola sp. WMC-M-20]